MLSGCLEELAGDVAEDNTEGSLAIYSFYGEDAMASVSNGTGDDLVQITMTQGADLAWTSITVSISIDNGAPVTCANFAAGSEGYDCHLVEFGDTSDQVWSVGDGVTIVESGTDLCSAGEVCVIKVTIADASEGKILDETTAIAE